MRFLEGEEYEEAKRWIQEAVYVARDSRCDKSKRGVVVVKNGSIIGRGTNNPPLDLPCVPEYCRSICNMFCLHGEQNALLDTRRNGYDPSGSRIYHIKVKDSIQAPSGPPSCVQCSRIVLDEGVKDFVLLYKDGIGLYEAREFHELSLENIKPGRL